MSKSTFVFLFTFLISFSAVSQNNLWSAANESVIGRDVFAAAGTERPKAYKLFRLQESSFQNLLRQAPSERTVSAARSSFVIEFPDAEGRLRRFRIVDAPVMAPELAAKYPGINSYTGKGIDDPEATIRFDMSMHGLHATIMYGTSSTVYIDRLYQDYYRIVKRSDVTDRPNTFECLTDDVPSPTSGRGEAIENVNDGKLRTYRLSMISGAEFSNHFIPAALPTLADSIAAVLAAQNSHVTRANAVYERDMGIRMVLVPNNDQVIYFDPATDPITNPDSPSGTAMQNIHDTRIGSGNYDIGHTESKGSNNGNAGCIGCVCTNGSKGRGWTVYSNPSLLEFFVIDYLTHEMGHQFGANHTFSHAIEGTGVNVEPGSGVTIMGYAGIVPGQNVELHSIDIFSVKSIEQISNYILTGGGSGCDVETNTGNNPPTADAGTDYVIPSSTPFKLTGTGSDPDAGDVVRFNWEQIDSRLSTATPSIPSPTSTSGPMFRTYVDYSVPERTFPALTHILSGANGFTWEVLPSVSRNLNFRFITKDNHPGGGSTRSDNMVVTVDGNSGPFAVTAPNSALTWIAGFNQTVTWSVNNSNNAPVSCANVRILLSTDGGLTFPTVLAASTLNDGSETVAIPCIATATARIKVEAIGNIFFDISNSDFSIQPGFDFDSPAPVVSGCPVPNSLSTTLGTIAPCPFSNTINLSATGNPAGTTVSFTPAGVAPGANATVTLNNTSGLTPGSYTITIIGTASGAPVRTRDITFIISLSAPPTITSQPSAQTVCVGSGAAFSVSATDASGYQWQVSTAGGPFIDIPGATSSTYNIGGATAGMNGNQYRVVVISACATSVNSDPVLLTVISPVSITAQPVNKEICSGSTTTFSVTASSTQTINYQWQVSTTSPATWNNVTNSSVYSGATTNTLTITNAGTGMSNYQYRVLVSNTTCPSPGASSTATLTVRQLPTVTLTAFPLTSLLPGQLTTLTANPSASTGGTLTTTWYLNGNVISNAGNTRVVNVEQTGTYKVAIAETFASGLICANQSADVVIAAEPSSKLFIFPSPNNGRFTISYYNNAGTSSQRRIIIVGAGGDVVYDQLFPITGPYTLLNIDMRSFSRGIYFVKVGDINGTKLVEGKVHVR